MSYLFSIPKMNFEKINIEDLINVGITFFPDLFKLILDSKIIDENMNGIYKSAHNIFKIIIIIFFSSRYFI